MPARFGLVLCWVIMVCTLAACADRYPNGLVQDRQQAIAVAKRECSKWTANDPKPWHAELTGDTWFAWLGPEPGYYVSIKARTGKTDGCAIFVR